MIGKRSELIRPIESALDDLFNNFFNNHLSSPARVLETVKRKAYPKMNIFEKDGQLIVEASVPGIKKENIKVVFDNNLLTITGKFENKEEISEDKFFIRELAYSEFSRSVQINIAVKPEIKAKLEDGIIKISLDLMNKEVKKEVEIQ